MFYTYAHYTPEGRLFYIGKGKSPRRAYNFFNRSAHWQNVVRKHGNPKVQVLANWNTEEEAFSHEVLLISCFRDMGYKLCNITSGGEGASGREISDEHKARISAKLKGRKGVIPSEETRKKMSLSHIGQVGWRKGKFGVFKQSKETVEKRVSKLRGRLYNAVFKYIGTNLDDGISIELVGNKAIKDAGFYPTCVRKCADGDLYRKSHKGYTWVKEKIKE